jgi:hypothetical protein
MCLTVAVLVVIPHQGDFSECSSALEFSYGIGMTPASPETTVGALVLLFWCSVACELTGVVFPQTFMAGKAVFRADIVEVWAIGDVVASEGGTDVGRTSVPVDTSVGAGAASVTGFSNVGLRTY